MIKYLGELVYTTTEAHAYHEPGRMFTITDTFSFYADFHDDRDMEDVREVIKQELIRVAAYDGPITLIMFHFAMV